MLIVRKQNDRSGFREVKNWIGPKKSIGKELTIKRCGGCMRVQVYEEIPVGEIMYLTENVGDAPISVYVIQGKNGDMLVDTGFYSTYKSLIKWIDHNQFHITDIFITHAHPDHDWNVAKLKQKYGARIWLSKRDIGLIGNFNSQKQYPTSKRFSFRTKYISFWTKTPFFKSKEYIPDVVIEKEGKEDALKYGYDFSIVFLPGHTLGSMGILKENTLYVGDAYAVISGVPMMPPHVASIEDAEESYKKIKEVNPQYLACGHGVPYRFE